MTTSSSHGAAASAIGYLYQVKWALLEVLNAADTWPDRAISIERLEDIAWEDNGSPKALLQLKHHQASTKTVGDKDDDVWRTLAVWIDAQSAPVSEQPELYLITTQQAAEASGLEALRPPHRNPELAMDRLTEAARTSRAKGTASIRKRFLTLSAEDRALFVERIHVLDSAPRIGDVDDLVRRKLIFALPRGHETTFLDLLWAWWYSVALDILQRHRSSIRATSVAGKISDLRDDFRNDNLPTTAPGVDQREEVELALAHSGHLFVHQMRWVDAPGGILQKAIVDYYRAITQEQLWLEDDLIGLHQLTEFEEKLKDEWKRELDWLSTELPEGATEGAKIEAGRKLLRTILSQTRIRVRERYDEPFFARGKCHDIADRGTLGWHPDFESRVAGLLLHDAS